LALPELRWPLVAQEPLLSFPARRRQQVVWPRSPLVQAQQQD
jgi:hypothetical protein